MPESTTTCLCTTAPALATVCGVKDMVDVIVRQAREIFRADLTFVAVTDRHDGSCRVQGALGAVSGELGLCLLPADLDRIVRLEGLHGIHTTPLTANGATVGLIGIGCRSSPPMSDEDVDRVATYAHCAAAALESAARYEAIRSTLSELTVSYAATESALQRARKQARAHEVLADALLGQGSVDHLVSALATALDARVWLVGDAGGLLAASDLTEPLRDDPDISVPVGTGSGTGELALVRSATVGDQERRILGSAAEVLSRLLSRPSDEWDDDDFGARWAARAATGVPSDGLLIVKVSPPRRAAAIAELGALALELDGVAGSFHGWPTLVVAADHLDQTAADAQRRLPAPALVCAHVVDYDHDLGGRSHELAVRGCRLLAALGAASGVARTDQLGVVALLAGADDDDGDELRSFVDRVLGPLIDYDARRGTELVATVAAFFASSGSNAQTARALGIHLNTVLKRFGRIDDLLGPDWRAPDQAFELQLAVRVHQLASPAQP